MVLVLLPSSCRILSLSLFEGLHHESRGGISNDICSFTDNETAFSALRAMVAGDIFSSLPLRATFTRSFIRISSILCSDANSKKDNIVSDYKKEGMLGSI
jgi:hypothetical protein